jgi:hypothetical protein
MTSRHLTGVTLLLACVSAFTWSCGGTPTKPTPDTSSGSGSGGGSVTPPPVTPPPPAATTAIVKVMVDSGCSGKDSNVQIYLDSSYLGVAQPGDSGVSKTVSLGDHSVSASGQRGTVWGPFSITVGAGGYNSVLTCNSTPPPPPPPPPATTATLRVQVDANCTGKAANVQISIDGVNAGTTQPGSSGISKVVSIGNHTIFAKASNDTTWPTFTVAVPANGFISNLTCR